MISKLRTYIVRSYSYNVQNKMEIVERTRKILYLTDIYYLYSDFRFFSSPILKHLNFTIPQGNSSRHPSPYSLWNMWSNFWKRMDKSDFKFCSPQTVSINYCSHLCHIYWNMKTLVFNFIEISHFFCMVQYTRCLWHILVWTLICLIVI